MLPSPAAKRKALLMHEAALHNDEPGTITISGARYAAAVDLGQVEFLPVDGGSKRGQRLTAHVLKSRLDAAPGQKTLVTHGGVEFKLQECGGRNATDVAWVLRCVRWVD